MERVYRIYDELGNSKQIMFDALIRTQKELVEKEKEVYKLQLEKKKIAYQLIGYLHRAHIDGIKKDNIITHIQEFSRGVPSFWQVFNSVVEQLCNKDKTILQNAYNTLSRDKDKVENLVVKIQGGI